MTAPQGPSRFYRVEIDRMCVHHHKTVAAAMRCPIGADFGLFTRPGDLRPGESPDEFDSLFGLDGVYGWPGGPFTPVKPAA